MGCQSDDAITSLPSAIGTTTTTFYNPTDNFDAGVES
jgi:hypothetical protein